MAYTTNTNENHSTSSISAKISKFLKNVGMSFVLAQEARARQQVKKYMLQSNRPL